MELPNKTLAIRIFALAEMPNEILPFSRSFFVLSFTQKHVFSAILDLIDNEM